MDTGWPSASGMTTWGVRDGRMAFRLRAPTTWGVWDALMATGRREYGGGVAGSGKVDDGTEHLNAA